MDFNTILVSALGLQDLLIQKIELKPETLSVHLEADLPWGSCVCARCGDILFEFHQWCRRRLRLAPIGIYSFVGIEIRYPRGRCRTCDQIRVARLEFVHPQFESLSCGLVELAGRMMEEFTCEATARLLQLDPKLLWKVDQWRMEEMKKHFKLPGDLDVSRLSADEVHFYTEELRERPHPFAPRWLAKYVTNLVCVNHGKVIANSAGREATSLKRCLLELTKPQRLSVEFFSVDMHPGFMRTITKICPNAEIAVDRFHLVQKLNEAFDQVRKLEFKKARANHDDFTQTMLSPGRRFILVERHAPLSIEEENLLGKLKMLNDNIHNAMLIVDEFHKVLDEKGVENFRNRLRRWYRLIRQARLRPLTEFALKVRHYRIHIEAYIRSNLTTAISEGLNNKIRVLKAMAYGYTNENSFMNKILQRCGYLNSRWMDTRPLFYRGSLA